MLPSPRAASQARELRSLASAVPTVCGVLSVSAVRGFGLPGATAIAATTRGFVWSGCRRPASTAVASASATSSGAKHRVTDEAYAEGADEREDSAQLRRPGLILIPGLGGDGRMFEAQRAGLDDDADIRVARWVAHAGSNETLPAYAKRLAARVQADIVDPWRAGHHGGDQDGAGSEAPVPPPTQADVPPYVLGGVSFGGAIAQEVARHLDPPPASVVLMSSLRSTDAIPTPMRLLARIAKQLPLAQARAQIARVLQKLSTNQFAMQVFGPVTPRETSTLVDMLDRSDPDFLLWGVFALSVWRPSPLPASIGITHVHGDADYVLPYSLAWPEPDVCVEGGGHVVNMTHATVVNAVLSEALADAVSAANATAHNGEHGHHHHH